MKFKGKMDSGQTTPFSSTAGDHLARQQLCRKTHSLGHKEEVTSLQDQLSPGAGA